MKLAEALLKVRAMKTDLNSLHSRIVKNIVVQEGEKPQENAEKLIDEFLEISGELSRLTRKIQKANSKNKVLDENDKPTDETLQEALSRKESLIEIADKLREFASDAVPNIRYSNSEIKTLPTVNVPKLIKKADIISKEARELDLLIQKTNWNIEI